MAESRSFGAHMLTCHSPGPPLTDDMVRPIHVTNTLVFADSWPKTKKICRFFNNQDRHSRDMSTNLFGAWQWLETTTQAANHVVLGQLRFEPVETRLQCFLNENGVVC